MTHRFPYAGYFALCVAIIIVLGVLSYFPHTDSVCGWRPIDANANIAECR